MHRRCPGYHRPRHVAKPSSTPKHAHTRPPPPTLRPLFFAQAVLSELQDAQEGVLSVTSPATQQDLAALSASLDSATNRLQQQQQQQGTNSGTPTAGASSSSSSARLLKLFAAGTTGSPAASTRG
jgi:hypothetical protein